MKGSGAGYIIGIQDPDIQDGLPNIVYVANGRVPWATVRRNLTQPTNKRLKAWVAQLAAKHEKFEILEHEVPDLYHGTRISLPPIPEGVTRIPWVILDYQEDIDEVDAMQAERILLEGSKKIRIIKDLYNQGHPLLNTLPGRPPLPPRNPLPTVEDLLLRIERLEEELRNYMIHKGPF